MKEGTDWRFLDWDEESCARFYDWVSSWEPLQDNYFSNQLGAGIVRFLGHVAPTRGRVLDFGCGPGYLAEKMLEAGIACEAMDSSPESVEAVNRRLADNPLWRGASLSTGGRIPFSDGSFDLVTCVETVEHVLPVHMEGMLSELRRVLKPDAGRLLITTPNSENLARNQVYCPKCGSVFHRVQHVSSFSDASLRQLLEGNGFETILCDVTDFNRFQQPLLRSLLDLSPRRLARIVLWLMAGVLDVVHWPGGPLGGRQFNQFIGRGPHLFWLGKKR